MTALLLFGLNDVAPVDATVVWGARAVIDCDGHVDFPSDRSSVVGDRSALKRLGEVFPPGRLRDVIARKLSDGGIQPGVAGRVTLYDDGNVTVVADTLGSGGYLHIVGWVEG